MRHLMSPLDFTTAELDRLFDLAASIEKTRKNTRTPAMAKSLPPVFTNPAHAPV